MDELILITQLNDFIFCPISIYFHNLYKDEDVTLYQGAAQRLGTYAHTSVDNKTYSTKTSTIQSIDVYCEKYGLVGKIDCYYADKKLLRERKRTIKNIYDGYVFQLYGQYFSLIEMGYEVDRLQLYSMTDNKTYDIPLPENDSVMLKKFEQLINDIRNFNMKEFEQDNKQKCENCIYSDACDRGM